MAHYYFDCSDAEALVMDIYGTRVADLGEARTRAGDVARLVMAQSADVEDWQDWAVDICDEGGNSLLRVPFAEVLS